MTFHLKISPFLIQRLHLQTGVYYQTAICGNQGCVQVGGDGGATLASCWMIMGIRPASMTAWTCCWFPAVMLDKNHTASWKEKMTDVLTLVTLSQTLTNHRPDRDVLNPTKPTRCQPSTNQALRRQVREHMVMTNKSQIEIKEV